MIHTRRMTAQIEGSFCVFLIGMRINRLWKVHKWWPVARAMPRMLDELRRHPELGLLGAHSWFGGRTVLVQQYWRSFEQLTAYARRGDLAHLPAWNAFRKSVGDSGDVGIFHETYRVENGNYEVIYHHMPPFGLGAVGELTEIGGRHQTAGGRMGE